MEVEEMYLLENLETGQLYFKILAPCLDSPSEEAISESRQINEKHETAYL